MTAKTKEQFTVVCEGLFINDVRPAEWKQNFPWEASVCIHYRRLDDGGQPVGEVQKKYRPTMWLFQAMGGKDAKGRYFRVEAESGEIPAKEGNPAKHYTTVTPIAEVFSNGTARFLEAPKDGKINTPGAPVGGPPPGKDKEKQPSSEKTEQKEQAPATGQKSRPKPNEKFIGQCFIPGTDSFFRMQDGFAEDGYVMTQAHELAMKMTKVRLGWSNQVELNSEREQNLPPLLAGDEDYINEFLKWSSWFEWYLSEKRWTKFRARLSGLLKNCLNEENVISLMEMAWAKLPKSHFNLIREEARLRLTEFNGEPQPLTVLPTATPEAIEPQIEATEKPFEPPSPEPPNTPPAPPVDAALLDFTVKGLQKIGDFPKMLAFWGSTNQDLRLNEKVIEAFRLQIIDLFMRAQYQASVDGILEKVPAGILRAQDLEIINNRYEQLAKF